MIVALAMAISVAPEVLPFPPGLYTNEEENCFDAEAKRTPAPWIGLRVEERSALQIDKFRQPAATGRAVVAIKGITPSDQPGRIRVTLADGRVTDLRRARTATCWGASPKAVKKPDGSEDWVGARDLKLHDQGGRISFGGGSTGAPAVVLRLRNVIWPSGPSRPSLVLYVHTPDAPDKAVSYSWADPSAKMIGINLRWMQASCTIDTVQEEKPS